MANRFLNNITINDAYTFPSTDGTEGQIITTDGSGTLSFADAAASDAIVLTVKNISGGSLAKGTVVHPSPSASPPSGNILEVIAADKSAASTMPAIGVLNETLADDAEGECIAFGSVKGIDTSSFSASDPIYVGDDGGFTTTKPSGTDLIQKIGIVVKVHASNGSIKVFGANRTNDVPAPLYVDIPNGKVGIGQSSPDVSLDINATDAIQMPAGTTAQRPTAQAGMFRYNTTDGKFEGYTTEWGEIGGGAGTVKIEKDIYTGDGSDTTFDTTTTISSENNVQVYLDGVYQSKDNYTTSGSTVTFSTAPPDGTSIELIHLISVSGNIILDTDTGDGSTTAFTLTNSVSNENNTQVYINGVYQSKDSYSVSGTTLTFSTAPANGTSIEVVHIKPVNSTDIDCDTATISGDLTVDTNTLFVDSSNDRVGIGTDSPAAKLQVSDSNNDLQMRIGSLTAGISPYFRLQGKNAANTTNYYADIELDAENGKLIFNDPGTSGGSVGQNPMVLDSSGNVGIGTTSPDETLHLHKAGTNYLKITNNTTGEGSADGLVIGNLASDGAAIMWNYENARLVFGTNNTERMRIDSSGRVGIGITSPPALLSIKKDVSTAYDATDDLGQRDGTATLHIENGNGSTDSFAQIVFDTADSNQSIARIVALRTGSASNDLAFVVEGGNTKREAMRLESDGDLHVYGDVIAASTTVSDKRLKDDIKTIDNALEKVESLRGVSYTWNKGNRKGEKEIGVVAQEVEQVFPEIVREKEMPLIDGESYKAVDYEKLVGVLIEAVKELNQKVKELENK